MKEWKLFEAAQGCTALDTHGLHLSMDKIRAAAVHRNHCTKTALQTDTSSSGGSGKSCAEEGRSTAIGCSLEGNARLGVKKE
jgi:hypothetical protein